MSDLSARPASGPASCWASVTVDGRLPVIDYGGTECTPDTLRLMGKALIDCARALVGGDDPAEVVRAEWVRRARQARQRRERGEASARPVSELAGEASTLVTPIPLHRPAPT